MMNAVMEMEDSLRVEEVESNRKVRGRFTPGADYAGFQGHFPGAPTLPGVCQILFVQKLMERVLEKPFELRALRRTKFFQPVPPGTELVAEAEFQWTPEGLLDVSAVLETAAGKAASVRMELAERGKEEERT